MDIIYTDSLVHTSSKNIAVCCVCCVREGGERLEGCVGAVHSHIISGHFSDSNTDTVLLPLSHHSLTHTSEKHHTTHTIHSDLDINGAEGSVRFSEVSSLQRLKCMRECYLRWEKVSV